MVKKIEKEDKTEESLPEELIQLPKTWKEDARQMIRKANGFVNNMSNLAYKASSLLATLLMSKSNPVAAGMAVIAVVPEVLSFFESDDELGVSAFDLAVEGFEEDDSGVVNILHELEILETLDRKIRWKSDAKTHCLISVSIDNETVFIYRGAKTGEPNHTRIWVKEGLVLSQIISKSMEKKCEAPCTQLSMAKNAVNLKPVLFNGVYEGKHDPVKFANTVEKFRRKGLDYSVILHGPPGTGKTSFIQSYAELRRKRVLIIGPEIISNGIDISLYIDVLKPDILLLDDYDRSESYSFAYTTLPAIKSRMPNMLVCITCNFPQRLGSAILRPGRGGHMIEFDAPDDTDRRIVFEKYMEFYKIPNPEAFDYEEMLAEITEDWTHDWIRHLAKMCLVFDTQEEIMEFIQITNKQLEWVGNDMKDDDDEEDDDDDE